MSAAAKPKNIFDAPLDKDELQARVDRIATEWKSPGDVRVIPEAFQEHMNSIGMVATVALYDSHNASQLAAQGRHYLRATELSEAKKGKELLDLLLKNGFSINSTDDVIVRSDQAVFVQHIAERDAWRRRRDAEYAVLTDSTRAEKEAEDITHFIRGERPPGHFEATVEHGGGTEGHVTGGKSLAQELREQMEQS